MVNLTKRELKESDYTNLSKWFQTMNHFPEIIRLDKKLKEQIAKYNFWWRVYLGYQNINNLIIIILSFQYAPKSPSFSS